MIAADTLVAGGVEIPDDLRRRLADAASTAESLRPVLVDLVAVYEEAEALAPLDTPLDVPVFDQVLVATGARDLSRALARLDAVIFSFAGSDR